MSEKEHINQPDEESTPRPKADVRLDTEPSVAELVELNRKNLPGTFEEARKQVEQLEPVPGLEAVLNEWVASKKVGRKQVKNLDSPQKRLL